jgi:hypothetical protein
VTSWKKWIEFLVNNSIVRLQGILPTQSHELQEISVEQVMKWEKEMNYGL